MSDNEKDNNNFEFIKEQVIEKKRKKIKKWLYPPIMTAGLAVMFGIIAAGTFVIIEPKLYKLFHKVEETKTAVCFPTEVPTSTNEGSDKDEVNAVVSVAPTPEPVIVKQSIDADINDYLSMNDDIRNVSYEVNKSLLNIASTFAVKDWFGNSEKVVNTTGVIIYNNNEELLVLVSLDRVKDAKNIKIVFSDSFTIDAEIQDYQSDINLAIIAVPIEDIPKVYMNSIQTAKLGESYSTTVGTPIIALGSPNGHSKSMETGIITSTGSYASITDNRLDLFNTSIVDNSNSDGIIVDLDGYIIGLITRTLKEDNNEYLNTVIGISKLKPIIEVLGNKDPHIYFGVKTDDMTAQAKIEHDVTNGIYVNNVQADSPAFNSGMQNGDVIVMIDDKAILNSSNFHDTISTYKPGDKIKVKIMRSNGTKDTEIVLNVVISQKDK